MTISRISDTHTRYLQTMERMAQNKAEKIASTRDDTAPSQDDAARNAASSDPAKEAVTIREEQKADRYASQIKEYEREEEDEQADEDREERLERQGVVTPEEMRRSRVSAETEDEQDERLTTEATEESRNTSAVTAADEKRVVSEEEAAASEEKEEEDASESKEERSQASEQALSPKDAYDMLSRNHMDSEFVIEMNSRRQLEGEADVLRGERDADRIRGVDTTQKEEQIRSLAQALRGIEGEPTAPAAANDQNQILAARARENFQVSVS